MIRVETEHPATQAMISPQWLDARTCRSNQIFDDGSRNVVAVQSGIQRGRVVTRARMEPVALQHTVVERRVGVLVGRVGAVIAAIRRGAIRLVPARFEHPAVLAVSQRNPLARTERDRRKRHVGRRQCAIAVVRNAVEPARV
jgi:hypothetical protein